MRSDQQRRAMFANLATLRGSSRRILSTAERRIKQANPLVIGGVGTAALTVATRHNVVHYPRGDLLKHYPQLRFYSAIPAIGAYIAARAGRGARKKTRKESLIRATTAGSLGLSAFLGERALFHGSGAFLSGPLALRREMLFGHGVPLGASALAVAALAHQVAKKHGYAKEQNTLKVLKTGALLGLGTVGSHFAARHGIPRLMMQPRVVAASARLVRAFPAVGRAAEAASPRIAALAQGAVDKGIVPTYLAYQVWKGRRATRRKRQLLAGSPR